MGFFDYFRTPEGLVEYTPEDFKKAMSEGGHRIIDVRTTAEYKREHIDGVELITLGKLKKTLDSLDRNSSYLLVCATGHRSRAAAAAMRRKGFNKIGHLKGGMSAWNSFYGRKREK
ncbi:MAG: rhodanese-like domain-containing protein [Candidatus Thermoplasmatota archaeon]|nr:rhodanese-like domain-containing protein [Candidatus Thermoplasmatota archaeon]